MKTLDKLLEFSHKREDNYVIPVVIEYFELQNHLTESQAILYLQYKYHEGEQ